MLYNHVKAVIYQGTDYELSWTVEDQITPSLVDKIEEAGRDLQIDWTDTKYYDAILLLLEKWTKQEIEMKIYDEDPDLIELVALAIQTPMADQLDEVKQMVRLYLPVLMIILRNI